MNDYDRYMAGDVLIKKIGSTWKWAYLRHGDGPDERGQTCDDPNYDNGYDGNYDGFYTFMLDTDLFTFDTSGTHPNGDKRPSGSGSYSYWMASKEIMHYGFGEGSADYTSPQIQLDTNPGGFKTFSPTSDPAGNTPYGTSSEPEINGTADDFEGVHQHALKVYHEPDYHLGVEDLTQIVYLDSRLDEDMLLTRDELFDEYYWYAYDSCLYSTVYDGFDYHLW